HELLQRRHARARVGRREPAARVQAGDLRGGEVLHLPRGPPREDLLGIGGAPQVVVVDDDEGAVLGALYVVLHPLDAQRRRPADGRQRVLGRGSGGAPAGDDDGGRRRGGPRGGDGEQEGGGPREGGDRGGDRPRVHTYSLRPAL